MFLSFKGKLKVYLLPLFLFFSFLLLFFITFPLAKSNISHANTISCETKGGVSGTSTLSCVQACNIPVSSGCTVSNTYCGGAVNGVYGCNACELCSQSCTSYCSGTTLYYPYACATVPTTCGGGGCLWEYFTNSSYCGGSTTPTPTTTPCTPGTGTTTASCGGNQTACMCNGTTCETQGYYCSAGSCVKGWAGGSSCSQSSCNGGAGCSGGTPAPTGITCQQCSSGTCQAYTYTSGSTCPTDCAACSGGGGTCMINKNSLNGKS